MMKDDCNLNDGSNEEQALVCESKDLIEQITNCRMLEIPVDSQIASSLASNFDVLEPSDNNSTGKLLPLVNILKRTNYIRKISFPSKKTKSSGNSEANILGLILASNSSIKEIDISQHNIEKEGLDYLCQGILHNNTLKILNISGNAIGPEAAPIILNMLVHNTSLVKLSIKNMQIEQEGIQEIKQVAKDKGISLEFEGNYVQEENLQVAINMMGVLMSLAAFFLLQNSISGDTPFQQKWSRMVQGLSLVALQVSSTCRHVFHQVSENTLNLLVNLDYISIYVLIAGTVTPLMVDGLGIDSILPRYVLVAEWLLCFFGIILHLAFNEKAQAFYADKIEVVVFLMMGWATIIVIKELAVRLSSQGLSFQLVGGGLYSFGIIFFYVGKKIPIQFVAWHICVLFGSLSMFISIFQQLDIDGYNMNGNKL